MPRGKYDRKESKIHRLEKALSDSTKKAKELNSEIEKKDIELKTTKKLVDVTSKDPASTGILPKEAFEVLRDNLRILSDARRLLVDSDQVSEVVLVEFDGEITAHLRLLGALRMGSFHEHAQPQAQKIATPSPFPATSNIPQFLVQQAATAR